MTVSVNVLLSGFIAEGLGRSVEMGQPGRAKASPTKARREGSRHLRCLSLPHFRTLP